MDFILYQIPNFHMNVGVQNIEKFGKDLQEALAVHGGKVSPQKWQKFLECYFSGTSAESIDQQIKNDLAFFQHNDPASLHYTWDQILSVRRGMIAIAAHRIFQKILFSNPEGIFDIEVLAKSIQTATNVEIHPQARFGERFAIDHGHGTII